MSLIAIYRLDVANYDTPVEIGKRNFSDLPLLEHGQEYQLSAWVGSLQGKAVTYESVESLEGYRPSVYGTGRYGGNNFDSAFQTTLLRSCYDLLMSDKNILAVSLRLRKKNSVWWRVAIWMIDDSSSPTEFRYTDSKTRKWRSIRIINLSEA